MKQIVCEMCGGHEFAKIDGMMVCQSCGTKYTVEEAKKMMIEGTVDVTGSTVKVDTSAELANLYAIARRARKDRNYENAVGYYEKVLVLDPNSWEATYFITLERSEQTTIGNIQNSIIKVHNVLDTCLQLIKDHVSNKEEQIDAIMLMGSTLCSFCSGMADAAWDYYNGIDPDIRESFGNDCLHRIESASKARYYFSDLLEAMFPDYIQDIKPAIIGGWSDGNYFMLRPFKMMNSQSKEMIVNRINQYSAKIHKLDPSYRAPKFKKGIFGWKIID